MESYATFLTLFDNIVRDGDKACEEISNIYEAFSNFVKRHYDYVLWRQREMDSLKQEMARQSTEFQEEIKGLEKQLQVARNYIDDGKKELRKVLKEKNQLLEQMNTVRDLLHNGKNKLHEETKEKLSFLNRQSEANERLDTIIELDRTLDHTDNLLSDLSHTFDEDTFEENVAPRRSRARTKKRQAPSTWNDVQSQKPEAVSKRTRRTKRSISLDRSEHLIATTTVTVPNSGPLSAVSTIKTHPKCNENKFIPSAPPIELDSDSDDNLHLAVHTPTGRRPLGSSRMNVRHHPWVQKAMIKGESCNACGKKLKFSKLAMKCKDCKSVIHTTCKDAFLEPCVPIALNTPNGKGKTGNICDYTPSIPPMVPPLVVYCIKEVESRGMNEVGLYRVPGADREVKLLKEKLVKVRGVPNLSNVMDINTICGCLKEFLRSLKEPLVTRTRWFNFSRAVDIKDSVAKKETLKKIISELPQPNRDTLAFIVLHLQRVCAKPEVKMSVSNMAKMFGPSVVGYSMNEPEDVMVETNQGNKVMSEIISLPSEFWESFISTNENQDVQLEKTPSSNSLFNFFAPSQSARRRNIKFFETP